MQDDLTAAERLGKLEADRLESIDEYIALETHFGSLLNQLRRAASLEDVNIAAGIVWADLQKSLETAT